MFENKRRKASIIQSNYGGIHAKAKSLLGLEFLALAESSAAMLCEQRRRQDCAAAVLLQLCVLFTRFEVKEPVSLARPPFASLPTVCCCRLRQFFQARNSESLMMQSGLKWL